MQKKVVQNPHSMAEDSQFEVNSPAERDSIFLGNKEASRLETPFGMPSHFDHMSKTHLMDAGSQIEAKTPAA